MEGMGFSLFCLNWSEPTSAMWISWGPSWSSVLKLSVNAAPFAKSSPKFIDPMVQELQDHLLMRGIFWMRRVQYSSPQMTCTSGPAETSWETPKSSLPQELPLLEAPTCTGMGQDIECPDPAATKKGGKHQSPSGYCSAERNGVNIWLLKGGRAGNPNQRRSIWLKVLQFFSKDDFRHSFLTLCQFYFLYSTSPTCAPWGSQTNGVPHPGWTQPTPVFTAQFFCMWGANTCPPPSKKEFSLFQHCKISFLLNSKQKKKATKWRM